MDKAVTGLAQIQRSRGKRPHLSMGGRERGCNKEFAAFSYIVFGKILQFLWLVHGFIVSEM